MQNSTITYTTVTSILRLVSSTPQPFFYISYNLHYGMRGESMVHYRPLRRLCKGMVDVFQIGVTWMLVVSHTIKSILIFSYIIDLDTTWHEYGSYCKYSCHEWYYLLSNYVLIYFIQSFKNDFNWASIHWSISFYLLHQLVKGAFKEHLMDWVLKYLKLTHRTKRGEVT